MRVGFLQFNPVFGDKQANIDRLKEMLQGVRADLLVLPELCLSGYQFRDRRELQKYAEPVPGGESVDAFAEMARTIGGTIVAGVAELDDRNTFNSSVLVTPEGLAAKYRKIHLFDREKEIFASGNDGFAVHKAGDANVGMMVCFDWIFPESARTLALMGADIIAHPANLVLPYCQTATPGYAIVNRIYIITSNRTGLEARIEGEPLTFTGQSQIVDPQGKIIARADETEDNVKIVEIDIEKARLKQVTKRNHIFTDRRPQFYKTQ
ncbi:MAG: nitrilase-related carbon-nitrogen hydrolase [Planctomycetota bacterium]|jgi:predicted amidohydrolase